MARSKAPRESRNRSAAGLLAGSLLLGFLGQSCFAFDWGVIAGLLLYLAASFIFVRSLRQYRGDASAAGAVDRESHASAGRPSALGSKNAIELLLVLVLVLVAAMFRLYRIDSQPLSLSLDEALTGLNALEILEGKHAPIWEMTPLDRWKPDWVKTSNGYLYFVVLVLKALGPGYFGLKMVSVLPGIASVLVVYFLFKQLTGMRVAFLTAFLTAVSQWHVTISRWGWDAVLMSFLQMVSYWFLIRGVKTGKKRHFAGAGVFMGLCLYTYIASWIALSIATTFLAVRAIRDPKERFARGRDLLLFYAACFFVFAPLGAHYLRHPKDLTVRASELTIAQAVVQANSYYPIWQSFRNHVLMFNYKGDSNPRHGFPNAPALDFVTSILFVLGLAYYLGFWKERNDLFILVWFALGLQGGLLAEPSASPHAYRTLMINPLASLFAATSGTLFFDYLRKSMANFNARTLVPAAFAIALSGYVVVVNYWIYFVKRPTSPQVWEEEERDGGLPVRIQTYQKNGSLVLVDPVFIWKIVVVNSWFLTYRPGKLFEPVFVAGNFLLAPPKLEPYGDERTLVYFFPPVFTRMIRSLFPEAQSELVSSQGGEPLYGITKVRLADLRERLRSADRERLADALLKTDLFYQAQLPTDAEAGPRRALLVNESKAAREAARKLMTR